MQFNAYDVVYSLNSHQHVSVAFTTIFMVILLEEYKGTKVVSCVAVNP